MIWWKFFRIIIIIFVIQITKVNSQYWIDLNGGTNDALRGLYYDSIADLLFVGGQFKYAGNIPSRGVAVWNGIEWDSLSSGLDPNDPGSPGFAATFCRFNSKVYAGGNFQSVGSINSHWLAAWDGLEWDSLNVNINGLPNDLKVWNNELYVCGIFDSAGILQVNGLAKWNDTVWSSVNSIPNFQSAIGGQNNFSCMEYYNGYLYIGGIFHGDSSRNCITYFDGVTWKALGQGVVGGLSWINCMALYDNELYVGGVFNKADGNAGNAIMKWNGNNWSDVGGGAGGIPTPQVFAMKVFNNELCIVGRFNSVGSIPASNIAKWDGNEWCNFKGFVDNSVGSIESFRNSIVIGGGFWTIDGDSMNRIAQWAGGNYSDSCSALSVKEFHLENSVIIYPIPTSSILKVKSKTQLLRSIQIVNILGEILYSENSSFMDADVNIHGLSRGIYFVNVETDLGLVVKRIIIN